MPISRHPFYPSKYYVPVGDQLDEQGSCCQTVFHEGFVKVCTRGKGHSGYHEAWGIETCIVCWSDYDPEEDRQERMFVN